MAFLLGVFVFLFGNRSSRGWAQKKKRKKRPREENIYQADSLCCDVFYQVMGVTSRFCLVLLTQSLTRKSCLPVIDEKVLFTTVIDEKVLLTAVIDEKVLFTSH